MIRAIYNSVYSFVNHLRPSVRRSVSFQRMMEKNDLSAFEKMYSSDRYLDEYLGPERLGFYETVANEVVKHIELARCNMFYLDVGCGTGHLMEAIRRRGLNGTIIGCDYAATAAGSVHKVCPTAEFRVVDIYSFDALEQYDFITCCEVLEHLKYPETAIANMLRALKTGGKLFITVPDGRKDTWSGHIHFWSPEGFALLLEKFGPYETSYFENCNFGILSKQ